jgi:small Trp-rich protein
LMKYTGYGSVANWPWWQIGIPFALAALWWWWADTSGYTKKKAMQRAEKKRQDRIDRQKDELGLGTKKRK